MAIKTSDLYSSLWASCDELRGGMDLSQYKDYGLFMLFIKYISDKYGDELVKGAKSESWAVRAFFESESAWPVGDIGRTWYF
jgi:type I restriction-modification system DNA methylase subunit